MNEYLTKNELVEAIRAIDYMFGSTNTADGIKTMRDVMFTPPNGDRPDVPNVAIVITGELGNLNSYSFKCLRYASKLIIILQS